MPGDFLEQRADDIMDNLELYLYECPECGHQSYYTRIPKELICVACGFIETTKKIVRWSEL